MFYQKITKSQAKVFCREYLFYNWSDGGKFNLKIDLLKTLIIQTTVSYMDYLLPTKFVMA